MTQATVGEIKTLTAIIPSGAATSSGFFGQGYRNMSVVVPVMTSAWLAMIGEYTGTPKTFAPFVNNAGVAITGFTPGGTGGAIADSQAAWLLAPKGFNGELRISAGANQAADRSFIVQLKG